MLKDLSISPNIRYRKTAFSLQLLLSSVSTSLQFRKFPSWGTGIAAGLAYHQHWFICRFQFIHSSCIRSSFWRSVAYCAINITSALLPALLGISLSNIHIANTLTNKRNSSESLNYFPNLKCVPAKLWFATANYVSNFTKQQTCLWLLVSAVKGLSFIRRKMYDHKKVWIVQ